MLKSCKDTLIHLCVQIHRLVRSLCQRRRRRRCFCFASTHSWIYFHLFQNHNLCLCRVSVCANDFFVGVLFFDHLIPLQRRLFAILLLFMHWLSIYGIKFYSIYCNWNWFRLKCYRCQCRCCCCCIDSVLLLWLVFRRALYFPLCLSIASSDFCFLPSAETDNITMIIISTY